MRYVRFFGYSFVRKHVVLIFFENEVCKGHAEKKFWEKWHCCWANVTERDIETRRLRDSFRIRFFHFFYCIFARS